MDLHEDDIPGYLMDALRSAKAKGLRKMLCVQIGESEPQWQVSTRFRDSGDYHISIKPDLIEAMMDALTPPAQAPASMKGGLFDDDELGEAPADATGLFD
jgi:hypothetical protein